MSWRKLKYLKLLNRKKGLLFFYINSDKIETTLTPTLDQTSFPETFSIPVVMSYSPRCCSSACCYGSLFMNHSTPALIRTEPRDHAEKKKSNKTCCNQNMPALPLTDDLLDLIDHNFFLQLLQATHQGFPISERTHLTQVSIKLL